MVTRATIDGPRRRVTIMGSMPDPAERRRHHQRLTVDVPVEFTSKASEEKMLGVAKNVSVGGMFVETPSPAAFGAAVLIGVMLPGQRKPLLLAGTVRWTSKSGMGVQFGALGARETHAITEMQRHPR
jgi:hypothetical protein